MMMNHIVKPPPPQMIVTTSFYPCNYAPMGIFFVSFLFNPLYIFMKVNAPHQISSSASHRVQEPFECYNISDIEAGLGLKRRHLIAISLLVGNDYDLQGVPGIGVDSAVRLVRLFEEDEILQRYLQRTQEIQARIEHQTLNLPKL